MGRFSIKGRFINHLISTFLDMKENIQLFKALGGETRYLIINALLSGERCACELPKMIGRTQSNTSMQLAILLQAGLIKQKRDGKKIIYSIGDKRIKRIFRAL
jgi:ArsR family transcriptional regulator, lead/cadmium/zinc/bismuth-responsive transcriptional repressor